MLVRYTVSSEGPPEGYVEREGTVCVCVHSLMPKVFLCCRGAGACGD